MYIYIYIYIDVNNGKESDIIEKNWKTSKSSYEFIVKESRSYNVSVLINHHQHIKNDDTECW